MREIKTGIYKHFKGKESFVLGLAKHSDRDEELVIYKGLQDGGFYARPYESFVEKVKNAQGEVVQRFELVKEVPVNIEELVK